MNEMMSSISSICKQWQRHVILVEKHLATKQGAAHRKIQLRTSNYGALHLFGFPEFFATNIWRLCRLKNASSIAKILSRRCGYYSAISL
jgi:hypothetical protein